MLSKLLSRPWAKLYVIVGLIVFICTQIVIFMALTPTYGIIGEMGPSLSEDQNQQLVLTEAVVGVASYVVYLSFTLVIFGSGILLYNRVKKRG